MNNDTPRVDAALAAARGDMAASNPLATRFLDPNSINYGDYMARGGHLGADAFVDDREAGRYNNIQGLLDNGGDLWATSAAHTDANKNYTANQAAMSKALQADAGSKFGVYKTDTQKQIDAYIEGSEEAASEFDLETDAADLIGALEFILSDPMGAVTPGGRKRAQEAIAKAKGEK